MIITIWAIKWFFRVRNLRRSTTFYIYAFLTSHKSFDFVVFCCWGEVVVPSEPPEREKTKKTAKYWTIIKTQPEHCDYWKPVLRAHQLNSKYLFCSCFNVAGYPYFISFYGRNIFFVFLLEQASLFKLVVIRAIIVLVCSYIILYLNH